MGNQFDRQRVMLLASPLFALLWLVGNSSLWAVSQNTIWLGWIKEIRIDAPAKGEVALDFSLEEYISEGTFDAFDEDKIVNVDKNAESTEWVIILDGVSPKKLKEMRHDFPAGSICEFLSVEKLSGSFADPNLVQTKQGPPISSSRIVIRCKQPVYMILERVGKNDPSHVGLHFRITDRMPRQRIHVQRNGASLDIRVQDFQKDRPVGEFLSREDCDRLPHRTRKHLERLRQMPPASFVSLIYRVRYAEVDMLRQQAENLLSDLGSVKSIEDNAQILIRDRADYVLEILNLLLALDLPVPQVMIDVQIIERASEDGREFSAAFDYLHESSKRIGGLAYDSPGSVDGRMLKKNHISGLYTQLEENFLNKFQSDINAEIRQGKSHLKASTRIFCKNRKTAQFNTGKSIPYYRLHNINWNDRNTNYLNQERTESGNTKAGSDANYTERNYEYWELRGEEDRDWSLNYLDTGVKLTFRPVIKNSQWVELEMKPSYSEIMEVATFSDLPVLASRSLETTVTVRNGDTFLLAGLLYDKEFKFRRGLPLLMDIPLLGTLFTSETTQRQQTELIFVLTVRIHYPGR